MTLISISDHHHVMTRARTVSSQSKTTWCSLDITLLGSAHRPFCRGKVVGLLERRAS